MPKATCKRANLTLTGCKTLILVLLVGVVSIVHQINLVSFATPTPSNQNRRPLKEEPSAERLTIPIDSAVVTTPPAVDIFIPNNNIRDNNNSLSQARPSDHEECQRKCHPLDKHYNIIILDHYEQAGLGDRLFVFRRLAILAGYLCARLYVPPPFTMLSTFHNANQTLPKNLTWGEMEDIRFRDDNSSALVSYELDPVDEHYGIENPFRLNEYFKDDPKYSTWFRLRFNDNANNHNKLKRVFGNQVRKLDDFVTVQQHKLYHHGNKPTLGRGFIWEVYPVLYHYYDAYDKWRLETITTTKDGENNKEQPSLCQYTTNLKSTTSHQVKDRVLEYLQQQYPYSSYFVPLHIRRGDTKDECDTFLATMKDFFECSFDGRFAQAHATAPGKITVLLATDEQDGCYRQAIRSMIEGLGHTFVDLDGVVWDVLRDFVGTKNTQLLNNMFVYKVISDIRDDDRIGAVLEKRRNQCPECQSLVALLHPETEKKTSAEPHPSDETRPVDSSGKIDLQAIVEAYDLCGKEAEGLPS